ncbi:hypothetical protein [Rhizobium alvei]|uniref:Uncharacterized protein n=1 Tax=Rhizobium alvei TaxID=1132659 RepID=A0ABT8YH87_9HYPH|nr:hypothetical protein [Rhizobium alvei]MDO6963043.1 hypothetical protein [Rhizobium alvei]
MIRKFVTAAAALYLSAMGFVTPGQAGEMVLSKEGGWKIILNLNADTSFNRCIMETNQKGQVLRLANNGKIWSLSVPAAGHKRGADGMVGFNNQQSEYFAFASDKSRAWTEFHPEMADQLGRSGTLEVSVGNKNFRWAVKGASGAMMRVAECVQRFNH